MKKKNNVFEAANGTLCQYPCMCGERERGVPQSSAHLEQSWERGQDIARQV